MRTKRIQLRIPEDWYAKMHQASLEAGYQEDDSRGTANSVSSWLKGLIAKQIGETEPMDYHQRKEHFAKCVHGELEDFRQIFMRFIDPRVLDASSIYRATYELGSLLQDVPKGSLWEDNLDGNDYVIFEWRGHRRVKERIHELLLRAVMHSVNYLAYGDIRLGGGSPPREKAKNLYPILEAHYHNRSQEGRDFSWINRALLAGKALCEALQVEEEQRERFALECIDLIERARDLLEVKVPG